MAVQYQGRMDHTEDSIQALFQAQYNTYRLGLVVVAAVAGVALAAAGLFAPVPVLAQGLLLLAGCMLFVGRDFPAIVRAESVIEARGGALPSSVCTFCAGHMELEEGGVKKKLRYEAGHRRAGHGPGQPAQRQTVGVRLLAADLQHPGHHPDLGQPQGGQSRPQRPGQKRQKARQEAGRVNAVVRSVSVRR